MIDIKLKRSDLEKIIALINNDPQLRCGTLQDYLEEELYDDDCHVLTNLEWTEKYGMIEE